MKDKAATVVSLGVRRIQPAYRQIADRDSRSDHRRPVEVRPAASLGGAALGQFAVSRNTIRESLRTLSSQGLIATSRGVQGGSFVALPDPFLVRHNLKSGLGLLRATETISPQELFETRVLLEVPATRWAARRRTEADIERMRAAAQRVETGGAVVERSDRSADFHQAVLDTAGNRLLSMIAPPVWRVSAFSPPIPAEHATSGRTSTTTTPKSSPTSKSRTPTPPPTPCRST